MNSELKPKIRFKGFTDDWEQRKLYELGEIMTGSTPSTSKSEYYSEDGLPWVTPTDIKFNTISDTPRKLSEEGAKVGRVVPANTILCTCIASIGKNALLTVKGSFNQQINSLTPNANNDPYFLLTESEIWSNHMKKMAASGTMQIVNKTEFSELTTMVPTLDEQVKIGGFFEIIDKTITLHQRKCDKLVELKKSLLEKMFPQNNSVIPEIRFRGFTDDWEQRKLTDLAKISIGLVTTMTSHYTDHGTLLVRNSDIKDNKFEFDTNPIYLDDKFAKENKNRQHQIGDVITVHTGDVGTSAVITEKEANSIGFATLISRPNKQIINSYYLSTFYNTEKHKRHALLMSTGDGRSNYNLGDFIELNIPVTNLKEQEKIGAIFKQIDNLITLHRRKHDKLNKIKQSLLNDMFV